MEETVEDMETAEDTEEATATVVATETDAEDMVAATTIAVEVTMIAVAVMMTDAEVTMTAVDHTTTDAEVSTIDAADMVRIAVVDTEAMATVLASKIALVSNGTFTISYNLPLNLPLEGT